MPRREKMLLCAGAVFLVLLFLMSSTDHKRAGCTDRLHFCNLKRRHGRLLSEFQKRNGKGSYRSAK